MSGPKISAYELEQRKKKAIAELQKNILGVKSNAMIEYQEIKKQINQLHLIETMIDAGDLDPNVKKDALSAISEQIADMECLLEDLLSVSFCEHGLSIEELQATLTELQAKTRVLLERKTITDKKSSSYATVLSVVREKMIEQGKLEEYSLEDALSDLEAKKKNNARSSTFSFGRSDFSNNRRDSLIVKAKELLSNNSINEETRTRLRSVIRRLQETRNELEIDEIGSLVINEIEKKVRLYEEFVNVTNQISVLADLLGIQKEIPNFPWNSIYDIKTLLQRQNESLAELNALFEKESERQEIDRCIDLAMSELGYDLIGSKELSTGSAQVSLFRFKNGTGLQITKKANGVIRVEVVGLSDSPSEENDISESEHEVLFAQQTALCEEYDAIIEMFSKLGVRVVDGTEKRYPPSRDFDKKVNTHNFVATSTNTPTTTSENVSKKQKKKSSKKKKRFSTPMVLSSN